MPGTPRWAPGVALAITLAVVPSSVWRIAAVTFDAPIYHGARGDGDLPTWLPDEVYAVLLSILAELMAFTAYGLVARWGETVPSWVPALGGRRIHPRVADVPAAIGAATLTAVWTTAAVTATLGRDVRGNRIATGQNPWTLADWEGVVFVVAYAPLLAWGPLLALLTVAYHRRRVPRAGRRRPCEPGRAAAWAAWGLLGWMTFSAGAHVYAATAPRAVVEAGPGPWGYTAYLIYDLTIVALSVVGMALALAWLRPWGARLHAAWLLVPAVAGSIVLVARGVPGLVEVILVSTGVTPRGLWAIVDDSRQVVGPDQMVRDALINTYFFVGAALIVPLTLRYSRAVLHRRRSRPAREAGRR